jgi:uncharacterized cupredoxin-like copper-binding protein
MRSFSMWIYAAAYWILAADFVYILVALLLPLLGTSPEAASFLPLLLVFLALFVVISATATFWPSAPRRAWFWPVGAIPTLLFWLLNAPALPYTITHPAQSGPFTAVLPATVGTAVVVVTAILAFREARAGRAPSRPSARSVGVVVALVAATLGSMATSFIAGASAGMGTGSADEQVDSTVVLDAQNTTYVEKTLMARSGQVLGVVVVNHDSIVHAFDIDGLNIHVPLPATSSTLIAVKPTASGSVEFYCSVPGHRQAGMDGMINVQ